MFNWFFGKKSRGQLGIDLGTYAIKIVELTKKDGRLALANYALAQSKENNLKLSEIKNEDLSQILKATMAQAKFESRRVSISLPVDKTFSTIMSVPVMPERELAAAIPFEAQKYVPVPVEEVVLDWSIIPPSQEQKALSPDSGPSSVAAETNSDSSNLKILLVAVPKEIINNLSQVAKLAGLEISALEQEAFSLTRSLVGADSATYLIADLGSHNCDLVVVDQGLVKISHSLEAIDKESILMEMDRIVNIYQMRYNKKVSQCLLSGGRANEKELFDFLVAKLKVPVKPGNPFARIGYQEGLGPILNEIGPQLAVAIGLAMRES